jgi:hypothetical protein
VSTSVSWVAKEGKKVRVRHNTVGQQVIYRPSYAE